MLTRISHELLEGRGFTGCGKTTPCCHPEPRRCKASLIILVFRVPLPDEEKAAKDPMSAHCAGPKVTDQGAVFFAKFNCR